MNSITVSSPAKINLFLEIVSKRSDGYHNISTVFHKISLCDELTVSILNRHDIKVNCNCPDIPSGSENLVHKAAKLLLTQYSLEAGVLIDIKKNIPAGAGLGGGSSNAASTLMALNRLFDLNMNFADFTCLSKKIGADVAFFTMDSVTALATGIGEVLTPLKSDINTCFVIIFPGFAVSTAWAYKKYSEKYNLLTKQKKNTILNNSIDSTQYLVSILHNDFEDVVTEAYPAIAEIKDKLIKIGAIGALMSGSGSSVFGVFNTEIEAKKSLSLLLSQNRQWKGFVAKNFNNC